MSIGACFLCVGSCFLFLFYLDLCRRDFTPGRRILSNNRGVYTTVFFAKWSCHGVQKLKIIPCPGVNEDAKGIVANKMLSLLAIHYLFTGWITLLNDNVNVSLKGIQVVERMCPANRNSNLSSNNLLQIDIERCCYADLKNAGFMWLQHL